MMSSKFTQINRILEWCRNCGSITTYEATYNLGILRLASRIVDIKKQGYTVTKTRERVRNQWGEDVSAVRYFITKTDISCQGQIKEDIAV